MSKPKIIRTLLLAAAALVAVATPSFAVEYWLRAAAFDKPMPGVTPPGIPMWGFAQDSAFGAADGELRVPGPELVIPAGDSSLTIHLDNDLTVPISIVINGQTAALPPGKTAMTPKKFTDPQGRQRIQTFTQETAPGNTDPCDYVWNNVKPGSYVYHSGTHPAVQVQMGLYGAAIKNCPDFVYGGTSYKQAYPNLVYENSVTLFYSEIDPALHAAVSSGTYGPGLAMTSTIDYEPKYFLVNGQSFDPASPPPALTAGSSGGGTWLRIFNMGLQTRCPLLLNSYMTMVAEDGQPYTYSKEQYVVSVPAAKTVDAQVAFPAAGVYPIFDRALGLTNAAATNGGMRANLAVTAGDAWPVITLVTATPASIPDAGTSNLLVTATDATTYAWMVPAGAGSVSDPAIANPVYTPPSAAGVHTYTLTVVVGNSAGIDIGTVDVTVTGNVAPVIQSVTATPMAMLSAGGLAQTQLQVTATDADGPAPLTYLWTDLVGGGTFNDATLASPLYTPPAVASGTQTFTPTVAVSDGVLTTAGTVSVIVAASNSNPVITSVTATPASLPDDQTSALAVVASDPDSSPLPLSYAWVVPPGAGSVSDATIANPVYTPPAVTASQIFTLTVNVSDGIGTVSGTVAVTVTPTNDPPVISSVTATPASLLDTKTSQLQVNATDPEGNPLTYSWTVPAGAGSVSNAAIANPVYTPPDITGADQIFILTVQVSDGLNTVSSTVNVTVSDALVLLANFTTGAEGFTYSDDAFNDTIAPAYESGVWNSAVGAGGALQVTLGNVNNTLVPDGVSTFGGMSGGWQTTFTLAAAGNVVLSFSYNLTQSPHYEADEASEVLVDVDVERVPPGPDDFVARITGNGNGGPSRSTGWRTFTYTLPLAAGTHTINIGGYNTKKDQNNEYTTVLIDDVQILRD